MHSSALRRIPKETTGRSWKCYAPTFGRTLLTSQKMPVAKGTNGGLREDHESALFLRPPADIQAILTVVGRRARRYERINQLKVYRDTTRETILQMRVIDLHQTDLRGADLSGADLSRARLTSADLRHAFLSFADLRMADLGGADIRGANVSGSDLRTYLVSPSQLEETSGDLRTKSRAGLVRPRRWQTNLTEKNDSPHQRIRHQRRPCNCETPRCPERTGGRRHG